MSLDYRFCIAPMMKKTDRHFRYLSRQFTKKAVLYTEMIHANAILKGNPEKLLKYKDIEHPVALQLGGCEPLQLAEAAEVGASYGYDEINLNVGCPSKKVRSGNFGVFLMKDIKLLNSCLRAMKKNLSIPLTVKCRIGVDQHEGDDFLNSIICGSSNDNFEELNVKLKTIEDKSGRDRSMPKFSARTLDIDIVLQINDDEEILFESDEVEKYSFVSEPLKELL